MKYYLVYIFLTLVAIQNTFSLCISEIMYNPSIADDTALEWVELYNDTATTIVMTNWTINTRVFSATLAPHESLIIARRLVATDGADSFEKYYGNNSGIWGDDPSESFQVLQASISLANSGIVTITVRDAANTEITSISYTSSDGANGNDKTVEIYSDEIKKESRTILGTPGIQSFRIVLDFSDTATKSISLHKNDSLWHPQFENNTSSYTLYSNTPGVYALRISGSGYVPYEADVNVLNTDITHIVTRTPIPRYTVSGTVTCAGNDKSATINLKKGADIIATTSSDINGNYALSPVEAATYTISAEKTHHYPYSQEIVLSADMNHPITLESIPSYDISFCVNDDAGTALNDAQIIIGNIDTGMTLYNGSVSGVGTLTLYAGNYVLYATREGHFPAELSFSLPATNTDVSISLVRTSMIIINEIDFIGSCEYIEIFNRSGIPVTLQGAAIADSVKSVTIPDFTITDYVILTPNAATLTATYGNDIHCITVPGFPVLNNDTDSVALSCNDNILEEVTYTASMLNGLQTSLDRLRADRPLQTSNLFPATLRTPGKQNSTYGLHNDNTILEMTEVAPFGSREYIEILVRDDGNNGNGALLADFSFTDLDTHTSVSAIVKTGDIVLCESLSLSDDADQALILRNGLTYAGMGWRKKTVAPSSGETDDLNNPLFASLPLVWIESSDVTLSFQRNCSGTWELMPASPGTLQHSASIQIEIPHIIQKYEKTLIINYKSAAISVAEIKIYDIGGIQRESAQTTLTGNGQWRIAHSLETGRFIYMITLKNGNTTTHKKGTFIAR